MPSLVTRGKPARGFAASLALAALTAELSTGVAARPLVNDVRLAELVYDVLRRRRRRRGRAGARGS
jgi:hypothetical protein